MKRYCAMANPRSHVEDRTEPIACMMWRFVRNNRISEGFLWKMKLIQRRAYDFRKL